MSIPVGFDEDLPSFREMALACVAAHDPSWRDRQQRWQWRQTTLDAACPVIGEMAVDQIGSNHVLAVLQPILTKTPETAPRLRGRIEVVSDDARVRRWRDGASPAMWKGNLSHLLPSPTKLLPVSGLAA